MFAWGANSHGQLGTGDQIDRLEPEFISNSQCELIAGGGGHSMFFDGFNVHSCGNNSAGQLGRSGTQFHFERVIPQLNSPVSHLACGWDFSFLLTKSGYLWSSGSNAFGQLGLPDISSSSTPILVNPLSFSCISAGLRHAVAITTDGDALSWGSNRRNQLGSTTPTKLHNIEAVRISHDELGGTPVACAAGAYHSTLLTANGSIILIGDLSYFRKPGEREINAEPRLYLHRDLFGGRPVVQVVSGWSHIVARTDSGDIYTWGRSDLGQLGRVVFPHPSSENRSAPEFDPMPRQVSFIDDDDTKVKIINIATGSEHNLAIDSNGNLWTWGWNEHGMCGLVQSKFNKEEFLTEGVPEERTVSVRTPSRVSLPPTNSSEGLVSPKVRVIGTGFGHSFACV
ncbi:unnamed protein product [Dicrocoelium dendriticum]|nr:unnamed protein product [Dicrocoelium dendriticum]